MNEKYEVASRRTNITTLLGTLEVRGLVDVSSNEESLCFKPANLKARAGFSLSREAIIELHRVLGHWIEKGNDSLDNDYYLAC